MITLRFSAVYGGAHVLGCTKIKLDSDAQSLQVEYDDAKKIEFKYKKNLYSFNIENNFARLIAVFENKPFDDEFDDTGAQMLVFPPESIPHSQPIYGLILSSKTHCCLDGFCKYFMMRVNLFISFVKISYTYGAPPTWAYRVRPWQKLWNCFKVKVQSQNPL